MCTFAGGGGLFGGGDDGGGSSTTTQDIPAWLKDYVTYGLDEAKNLYESGGPKYYPGQTYLDPSQDILSAYGGITERATAGSPLLQGAQSQQLKTLSGDYLSAGNPYLSQALQGAQGEATQAYLDALKGGRSGAIMGGRMGSGAQQEVESRQEQNLANALSSQAGKLYYQNYADERARQEAAAGLAPSLSQADYFDLQQQLGAAKGLESYDQAALEGDIARFNFGQMKPYEMLSSYLGAVYGAPTPMTQTTTQEASGGKIVCTMMNESYGFGSFRNAVWLKHSADMPNAKVYEKGYHTLFLPLVDFAKGKGRLNKVVKTVLEHIARHRTADIWLQKKGKRRDMLGRIYRNIFEPICYVAGKLKGVK